MAARPRWAGEGELPTIPAALAPTPRATNQLPLAAVLAQIRPAALDEARWRRMALRPGGLVVWHQHRRDRRGRAGDRHRLAREASRRPLTIVSRSRAPVRNFWPATGPEEDRPTLSTACSSSAPVPHQRSAGCWRPDWWMRVLVGAPTACAG